MKTINRDTCGLTILIYCNKQTNNINESLQFGFKTFSKLNIAMLCMNRMQNHFS